MATIRARRRQDGTLTHQVLWRDRLGRQQGWTELDPRRAAYIKRYIDQTGDLPPDAEHLDLERPTVRAAVEAHIAGLTGITDRTRADYRSLAEHHIYPTLGELMLDHVDRSVVAEWLNGLKRSDKTVRNIHSLLSSAMETARERGWRHDNPCKGLRMPRTAPKHKVRALSHDEFDRLLDCIPPYWRPFVTFLVGTGLRFSEATALTVGDIVLDSTPPVVLVTKAHRRTPDRRHEVGPTKTEKGERAVGLPPQVVAVVWPLLAGRKAPEPLFTTPRGVVVDHAHFFERVWKPARAKADLGWEPRIHGLRHTHAAWSLLAGMPIAVLRDRLGHESITTTVNTYGAFIPDVQAEATTWAGRALPTWTEPEPPPAIEAG